MSEEYKEFVEFLSRELENIRMYNTAQFVEWVQAIVRQYGGKPPVDDSIHIQIKDRT